MDKLRLKKFKMQTFQRIYYNILSHAKKCHVPVLRSESAKILVEIIKSLKPKRILEIGTATGYSALLMLQNSPNSNLITLEKDPKRLEIAVSNFAECGVLHRVQTILCDANEQVKLLDKKFDFIFLDGPKSHYGKQFPYLLKHLEIGGTIVCDNVLFMNEVLSDKYPAHKHRTAIFRMREFLDMIQTCPYIESKLIQIEDGLLICKKIKEINE